MKTKTILKTIGFLIGWIISFQLIGVGTYLMNQPSNIAFTFGLLVSVAIIGIIICFAWNTGGYMAKLLREYSESKKIKQDKKEL